MQRNTFIKMSSFAALAILSNKLVAGMPAYPATNDRFVRDDVMMQRLAAANDKQVEALLQSVRSDNFVFSRKVGADLACLAASYCYAGSSYYQSASVVHKLEILIGGLEKCQTADGSFNNSANPESPPDTAFLIEYLNAAAAILIKNNSDGVASIKSRVKKIIVRSGESLVTGGIHTPNHRWVVCAALAGIHAIYPNKKYLERIEDWLGEGIFMDSDGHYPERSRLYGGVENNSLLTMGRLLNKPALFNYVRKNLASSYYYMEPNGELVTTD